MSRKVVVNGRFLLRRVTGVERYGREVLQLIESNCRVEQPKRRLNGIMGHGWEQFILPSRVNSNSMLWSPANTGPVYVRNQILTIHDLTPLRASGMVPAKLCRLVSDAFAYVSAPGIAHRCAVRVRSSESDDALFSAY